MEETPTVVLPQIMVTHGSSSFHRSSQDQPFIEWIPSMFSTGYYVTDQLTQWLVLVVNIS